MNRTQQILSGLIVVQIALAVVVLWPNSTKLVEGKPLFPDLNADQIVAFSVDDNNAHHVALERSESGWILSNSDGYAADAEKIDPLLAKMVSIQTGRQVASKAESFARLQVADEDFLRRVWFKDVNGNEYILFVGSSVGAAATHVRKAGTNDVLLTDQVSSYEFGSEARNWIDVVYLAIPREQMTAMALENAAGTLEFVNQGTPEAENWVMMGLPKGEEFNSNNLVSMLTRLTNLQMTAPLGKTEKPEFGLDKPSAVVTVTYQDADAGAQTVVLRIGALDAADNSYYVHASNAEYYVKIPKYSLQDFVDRTMDVFLKTEETQN
jgi:hypothetical protein